MVSYTDEKKMIVKGLIDSYTKDTLDNYVRDAIKEKGITKMNEGASAIEVADAIFDYINENFSSNVYMATSCQQICPKSILLVLRNEIIIALK